MNMTHFAISGVQMHIGMHNNMEALRSRIGIRRSVPLDADGAT